MTELLDLATSPITLLGRIMPASNQTWLGHLGPDPEAPGAHVVYKPIAGERPLWDFPDGTLAGREYAAWLVSESLGWGIVPPTLLREGPAGPGMVQRWQDIDDAHPVDVVPVGATPAGFLEVLEATGADDEPVLLVHEDSAALRRIAIFDVLINNTDRKGGHVLPLPDGRRLGVDHGVCFHVEDKLRTVLWGWSGQSLEDDELDAVRRVLADDSLADDLGFHLHGDEVAALRRRGTRLLTSRRFPEASPGWPSIPWPPF